jgi:hypothetical protein
MEKRTLFRIALAVKSDAGERYTATDFARDHDVSTSVLWGVLSGNDTSARLEAAIDAFIQEHVTVLLDRLADQSEATAPNGPPVAA